MATIRLRGGPYTNSYRDFPGPQSDQIKVTYALPPTMVQVESMLDAVQIYQDSLRHRRGHYSRTNIKTKRGIPVYQWMGWEGEEIAR